MSLVGKILQTKFWEPEEAFGHLWDKLGEGTLERPSFPQAAVELAAVKGALGVMFRGLGGDRGVEIKPGGEALSHHRRSWRRRVFQAQERIETARFDGATLVLPEQIDAFLRRVNRSFILARRPRRGGRPAMISADPLRRDVARLRRIFARLRQSGRAVSRPRADPRGARPRKRGLAAASRDRRSRPTRGLDLRPAGGERPKGRTPLERALAGERPMREPERAPLLQDLSAGADVGRARGRRRPPAGNVTTTTRRNRAESAAEARKKR